MRVICLLIMMLCAQAAQAQYPVTYQKERLILHPTQPSAVAYAGGVLLEVDIQEASRHEDPDWMQLTSYQPGAGMLAIYAEPAPLKIVQKNMMAAVDVIAVNVDGRVVMIAPDLVLSKLTQPIERGALVKAFLYVKSGLAETIGLQPGDEVEHKIFTKPPMVMDSRGMEDEETAGKAAEITAGPAVIPALNTTDAAVTTIRDDGSSSSPKRRRPMGNPVVAAPSSLSEQSQ